MKLEELSNGELFARLRAHVGRGNTWLVELLAYLAEIDTRRAYAEHACSSTWDFCVRRLRMSEGEALRRIAAARVLRQFPVVHDYVVRGELHLSAIYELHRHLTPDNHEELLREAAGKSTKAVAEMIAARFPKPDVFSCIEPLAPQAALPLAEAQAVLGVDGSTGEHRAHEGTARSPSSTAASVSASGTSALAATAPVLSRIEPLSATRYRLEMAISAAMKERLERIRDLMLHRNPTGDLERIFEAALGLLLAKLEKERLGKTTRSHAKKGSAAVDPSVGRAAQAMATATSAAASEGSAAVDLDAPRDAEPSGRRRGDTPPFDAPPVKSGKAPVRIEVNVARQQDASATFPSGDSVHLAEVRAVTTADDPAHASVASTAQATGTTSGAGARDADVSVNTTKSADDRGERRRGHIPIAIRREVFARDGDRCTFVDAEGHRCPARGYLELDHVDPKALGGDDTAANLRVRCRAHNLWHAAQVFGRAHVEERIHLRRRRCAAPCAPSFDAVTRGLRSLGFREAEVRAVMGRLQASLDPVTPEETILREALRLLT